MKPSIKTPTDTLHLLLDVRAASAGSLQQLLLPLLLPVPWRAEFGVTARSSGTGTQHCAVTFSTDFWHSQERKVFATNLVSVPGPGEMLNLHGLDQPAMTANEEANWRTDFWASVKWLLAGDPLN